MIDTHRLVEIIDKVEIVKSCTVYILINIMLNYVNFSYLDLRFGLFFICGVPQRPYTGSEVILS